MKYRIPGVSEVDQPIYKIQMGKAEAATDTELLISIIRPKIHDNANPKDTIKKFEGRMKNRGMDYGSINDLVAAGLTQSQAVTLNAAFELSKRILNQGLGIEPTITSPADVLPELRGIKDTKREHFVAIFLNARNQVICTETISIGSLNASLVHPREVFSPAVGKSAAALILAHNHPSGDCTPSREDIELTRRMVQASEIMGIEILDHLIVSSERFLSMKEANVF